MLHYLTRGHTQTSYTSFTDPQNYTKHPELWNQLLFVIAGGLIVLILGFLYLTKTINAQEANFVWNRANPYIQRFVYIVSWILFVVTAAYSIFANTWTEYIYILWFVVSALIGIYLILDHCGNKFALLLSTIVAFLFTVVWQWLVIQSTNATSEEPFDTLQWNFLSAGLAAAAYLAALNFSQLLGFVSKAFAAIIFFIGIVVLWIGLAVWDITTYIPFTGFIGFIVVAVILLISTLLELRTHYGKEEIIKV